MPLIHLVRHAEPDAAEHDDPALGASGRRQAAALLRHFADVPRPLPVVTSPLRRCRQTIEPLCATWQTAPTLDARLRELPSPQAEGLQRADWLRRVLPLRWTDCAADGERHAPGYAAQLRNWQAGIVAALRELETDTVICTHFLVINTVLGGLAGDAALCHAWPANASVTIIEQSRGRLRLRQLGAQLAGRIV